MAGVLLLCAEELASGALSAPNLTGLLRASSALLLLNVLNGAQTGILSGLEAFRRMASRNVVAGLFGVPLTIGAALLWGVTGALAGLIGSAALLLLLNLTAVWHETQSAGIPRSRYSEMVCELPVLWRFSVPATLSRVLAAPVVWWSTRFCGPTRWL